MPTKSSDTTERRKNGSKRSIGITELVELVVVRVPGAILVKDGSNGDIPSDVFVRRYKLPPQIVEEVVKEGPVFSFIYHLREGWAQIKVNRDEIKDMDSADIGDIIRNIWNTKISTEIADKTIN
jgi:hypothetical protein